MTFDLISGLHMQIQTWHPPLWLCTHAKYYAKSGLTNVLKNANKIKNMHLFLIRIANYNNQLQWPPGLKRDNDLIESKHQRINQLNSPIQTRLYFAFMKSKKGSKGQKAIQSSTTPDPEYQWESDNTNESQEVIK